MMTDDGQTPQPLRCCRSSRRRDSASFSNQTWNWCDRKRKRVGSFGGCLIRIRKDRKGEDGQQDFENRSLRRCPWLLPDRGTSEQHHHARRRRLAARRTMRAMSASSQSMWKRNFGLIVSSTRRIIAVTFSQGRAANRTGARKSSVKDSRAGVAQGPNFPRRTVPRS